MRAINIILVLAMSVVGPSIAMDQKNNTDMDLEEEEFDDITEQLQQINLNKPPRKLIRQHAFYHHHNDMSDEDDTEEVAKDAEI